ncbi:MAG: hypothetical protein EP343_21205 [Deltaproteobacteria bacterium]|nr:MAG: hypothetical protein EP343_21205 [Deltaproteobacteria bacterium]
MKTPSRTLRYHVGWVLALGISLGIFLGGCNQILEEYEFSLEGSIASVSGAGESGTITVELYHAESGEGTLKQPLLLVTSFKLEAFGNFSQTVKLPVVADRKGLVVYAWVDADKDGALCTPEKRDEGSDLVVVDDFPQRTVKVSLSLGNLCQGPEAMYPPNP